MRLFAWTTLGLIVLLVSNGLLVTGPDRKPDLPTRPVILFWPPPGDHTNRGTYVTAYNSDLDQYRVAKLVVVTGHMRQSTDEQMLEKWDRGVRRGTIGVGIDEFIPSDPASDRERAGLLNRFRQTHPDIVIAVWHSGFLNPILAKAYRQSADLVMLETYGPFNLRQIYRIAVNSMLAHWYHIADRCVFGFGIDDASEKRLAQWGPWANSQKDLRRLIRFGKLLLPGSPGVAFFAPFASDRLLQIAEKESFAVYPR